jgi:di/tricarboxylate transporter
MTLEIGLVFAILAAAVLLFITGWIRSDIVALLVLVSLAATGLLDPRQALEGFSSEAVIAIAGLLVLSAGLVRSGVVRWIAERLDDLAGDSPRRLMVVSSSMPGILSGLVSDIATVSLFIPVVLRLARKNDMQRSKLLLPVAMAALAGGNLTLIGASHNLVTNDLLQGTGEPALGFFEIAPVGIALVVSFALYTVFFGQTLLSGEESKPAGESQDGGPGLMKIYQLEDSLWEVLVRENSPLVGKDIEELHIGGEYGLVVLSVIRHAEPQLLKQKQISLEEDDILLVGGHKSRLQEMVDDHPGLQLLGHPEQQEEFPASSGELVEVVVPPRSPAIGNTLVELDFRQESCLTGVAIWRNNQPVRTDVGTTALEEGDALLLYGPREQTRDYEPRPEFVWLEKPDREKAPRELRHLGKWAALIMLGVILAAAFELLPIPVVALGGAALMVLLGILTPQLLYEHIEWRTIVLVGGMYSLGLAMEESGAAGLISTLLVNTLGAIGPLAMMLSVTVIAMLLTQSLHGAAVAVIMTPVAMDSAALLGVEPRGFAVAVIVGAAATYLLPVGHPAPLLVQRPGGYETRHYVRFGLGLVVITLLVVAVLVPLLWPF